MACLKRGTAAASHGIKATYCVKIGQKRSRQTEQQHARKQKVAKLEGVEGMNQLNRWFKLKGQGSSHFAAEEGDDNKGDINIVFALREEEEESDEDNGDKDKTNDNKSSEDDDDNNNEEEDQASEPSNKNMSSAMQHEHVNLSRNQFGSLSVFSLPMAGLTPVFPFLSTPHLVPDSPLPLPSPFSSHPISPRPNDIEADDEQPPAIPCELGSFLPPPSTKNAKSVLADIKILLKPPQDSGAGYKDQKLDLVL